MVLHSNGDGEDRVLVSFDVDGTMEFGDPPGPVSAAIVLSLVRRGFIVGCASDRAVSGQARLWLSQDIELTFVGGKHHLSDVRDRFHAARYLHVGDTDIDEHYAKKAGFEYFSVLSDLPAILQL